MSLKEEEKYLLFFLNDEYYGIPILQVNEIIGLMDVTTIPRSPDFMKGVINLRGKIIPVIDLRLKFGMTEREYDEQTCIIIVELKFKNTINFVGLLVDKVAEVVNVYGADVEAPPQYGQLNNEQFLIGIGKVKGNVVMLLNIDFIIKYQEIVQFIKNDDTKKVKKEKEEGEV